MPGHPGLDKRIAYLSPVAYYRHHLQKSLPVKFLKKRDTSMRVAIVHPWFLAEGGAEKTVEVLAAMFPDADLFTLIFEDRHVPPSLRKRKMQSLNLQWVPAKYKLYRYFLLFYPMAFEALDLRGYDLVITSDSCVAKGVLLDQTTIHLCYCYSPMRCLYDQYWQFYYHFPVFSRHVFAFVAHYVRMWDYIAAQKVTALVADSYHIAQRINKYYGRPCRMIYPPVDTGKGYIASEVGNYYLSVGRITNAKRVDLLIEACNQLGRRLIVVGSGRELPRMKRLAGPTIEFSGRISDDELSRLYAKCKAFLFPAEEDFGIVPVEAQAYGRPVIALGRGGSLETVIDGVTGIYFNEQTVEAVKEAILRFEDTSDRFLPETIQRNARRFDTAIFKQAINELVVELGASSGN